MVVWRSGWEGVVASDRPIVPPIKDRGDGVAVHIQADEAVPKTTDAHRGDRDVAHFVADFIDHRFGQAAKCVRIEGGAAIQSGFDFIRDLGVAMLDCAASRVIEDGASR